MLTPKLRSLIIWMIGNPPDLCREFSHSSGNVSISDADLHGNVSSDFRRFFYLGNYWRNDSDTNNIIAAARNLKYFKDYWTSEMLNWLHNPNTSMGGAIVLLDGSDILSIKHGLESIKFLEDLPMTYVVALRATDEFKSWHSKIKILTDESTLTYDPNDKISIKQVWLEMIRRFELDAQLEQRFVDCIKSRLV